MFNYVNPISFATTLIALTLGTNTNVFAAPINPTELNIPTQYLVQMNPEGDEPQEDGGFMKKLNLTPEQTTKIKQIRQKYQPQIDKIRNDLRSEREKLKGMMSSNQNTANLRTQHQKIVALNQQLNNIRFESMLETRELLTPQQRQQFAQMMEQKRPNRNRPPKPNNSKPPQP
jgi:Spy/CpxP family protein refolding chaperone